MASTLTQTRDLGDTPSLQLRDTEHCPWNKRYGEVKSFLIGRFTRPRPNLEGRDGLEIIFEETVTHAARATTRTISVSLTEDQLHQLAAFLVEDLKNL